MKNMNPRPVHIVPIIKSCHQFAGAIFSDSVFEKKANIKLTIKYCQNARLYPETFFMTGFAVTAITE